MLKIKKTMVVISASLMLISSGVVLAVPDNVSNKPFYSVDRSHANEPAAKKKPGSGCVWIAWSFYAECK